MAKSDKVDVKLSHPWTDNSNPEKPKAYDTEAVVSVTRDVAERLVTGGTGVFATKAAATEAGLPDARTARSVK